MTLQSEPGEKYTQFQTAVRMLIQYAGYDPDDEHFVDTPRRYLSFLDELKRQRTNGVTATTFSAGKYDSLIVVRHVPVFALCAHHMLPFTGEAAVGYLPQATYTEQRKESPTPYKQTDVQPAKMLGVSKLARAVQVRASGLTVQEDMSEQVADDIIKMAETPNVAVTITATHMCMVMRGARADGAEMVTETMRGKFRTEPGLRAEFIAIAGAR